MIFGTLKYVKVNFKFELSIIAFLQWQYLHLRLPNSCGGGTVSFCTYFALDSSIHLAFIVLNLLYLLFQTLINQLS